MKHDEEAQVHILEMLTLFWLFFMSATFLIRVHVPDAPSVAHDASLEIAGDDAVRYALGLEAEVQGENRLEEVLSNGELDAACTILQDRRRSPAGRLGRPGIPRRTRCWPRRPRT